MKKILILTAGFGDGHNAAARALRDAIELTDEDARAEVLDLFADSYGAFNTLVKKTYLGVVAYAPKLWGGIYSLLENPFVEKQLGGFTRLQTTLEKILTETQPDCVVSTYPVYAHVIKKIYAHHHERPFRFITVITDSISINSAWFRAPSDFFCVANEASADILRKGGVPGFDCICITDHLADPKRLIGKLSELANFTLGREQIEEYFAVIERERQRAWRRYKMLVMTGIEFNKDGYTRKTSAHLLGIDLKAPISASLEIPEIIAQIHSQGGLAVASHPHIMKSEWGKNTLYLWENQEKFAPLLDAWEIANRNNIFNDIGLKRLPFIANSDFHKPKHIYSWKTLIYAAKNSEAVKDCIRRNEHVAITLYRDFANAPANQTRHGFDSPAVVPQLFQERLPLRVVNS
ncbi:MAG: MGDG synthase family glycosyltransferase [Limisphaerales bacterium]